MSNANLTHSFENSKKLDDPNIDEDYDSENSSQENSDEELLESETENETETENNEKSSEQVKKKRGRKCKPKDENSIIEKVQKKRGRKPKVKEADEVDKVPKKRGRKPKEKVYSVKELPKTFFEENKNETFILHLPIKISDQNNNSNPMPSLKNDNTYSMYDEGIDSYKVNENNLLPTQFNLLNENDNDNLVFDNDTYIEKEKLIDSNEDIISIPVKLKDDLKDDDIKTNKVIKKNLRNILYEFINANNEKVWPDSTNIHCWWCCHTFSWVPCALPESYRKEKFYVNGCFCTFNCAASYNFSKNDDNMWERYSLLNLMYKKLYNRNFIKINLAPPRETLKMFGGYLSIDEFRENSYKNEKTYMVVKPPLISIIPKIEENIATTNKNLKNNFPLVNENILNKTQSTLKLKRNKPVTNPNSTLQSFMDLKII
jgi:hypothetical protein